MRTQLVFSLLLQLELAGAEGCPGIPQLLEPIAEEEVLRCRLPSAHSGYAASIAAVIRLAGGSYINSAEGGEFLNATFMDLPIAHPPTFLAAVDAQEATVRERVIQELHQPVHDAYSASDLLAAVRLAVRQGLERDFIADLECSYAESAQCGHETDKRLRNDLETAAESCLKGHSAEERGSFATAMAREKLSVSPHDPVVGAIAVDLADLVGSSRADEIFLNKSFMRWACNAAAFYHHAMAQYESYGPRWRQAFNRVCARQASAALAR